MAKFRGITWNNSMFGPKIQVRRSIDIAELGDFGNITDTPNDLPTRGALHRTWTDSAETPIHGAKSGTRSYTDLRYVYSNVVDTQDMGLISDTTTPHRIWSSTGAISDVVTTAPTTLGNPGSTAVTGYTLDGVDINSLAIKDVPPVTPDVMIYSRNGQYVFIQEGQNVYRATLSTLWDPYTAGDFTLVFTFGVDTPLESEGCHFWSDDGTYFYQIVKHSPGGTELIIQKHAVTTAWDMTTYTGNFYSENRISYSDFTQLGLDATTFTRLKYSQNGEYMIVFSPTTGEIVSFPVGNYEAWHTTFNGAVSTVAVVGQFTGYTGYQDITFNSAGTRCWITVRNTDNTVYIVEYTLSSPWDMSTITFSAELSLGTLTDTPLGCYYYNGKLYIAGTDWNNTGQRFISVVTLQELTAAASYTYTITIKDSGGNDVTTVTEGSTYTVKVTTDAPDGTYVWISGQEDLQAGYTDPVTTDWLMDGTQSIARKPQISGGQATTTLTIVADETTESGYEKFRFVVSDVDSYFDVNDNILGTTPWVTISDTSQTPSAPDLTQYDWTFSTSVDIGAAQDPNTGQYYLMSNYDDPTVTAQLVEGDTATWTITTNAPDGTQVYAYQSGVFMGAYEYNEDPSGNYSEFYYQGYPYGWYTVQNGQISGTLEPIADGYAEDGELVQFVIKDSSSWSYGQYNELAESEWIHLIDTGTSTGSGSSGSVGWTAPTSDEYFTGGESVFDSGSPQAQWYMPADNPISNNSRFRIRMNENVDTDLRRDISYCLDNLEAGEYIKVGDNFGFGLTVWGNISKVDLGGNGYYDYYFDVTTSPTSAGYSGTATIYEYTVYAR
jgi:hypothetical protein